MRAWLAFLLLSPAMAGCADSEPPGKAIEADQFSTSISDASKFGVIRGVVVDEAIVPVADVLVRVLGTTMEVSTDAEGRFGFSDVPAGTHFLNFSDLLHLPLQTTVLVEAGREIPTLVKVQIQRRFDQDPFMEQQEIQGYINCGYSAGLSSPCIIDYTQLVFPGGLLPLLYGISGDVRRFVMPLRDGWQSLVTEMVWEPSIGTSPSLSMTASFYNRTTSHTYTGVAGQSPLPLRMDMDLERDHPDWIPPGGLHDFLVFVNPSTTGSGYPVAVVVEQSFEMFHTVFYYGLPPDGWSFVNGDATPF